MINTSQSVGSSFAEIDAAFAAGTQIAIAPTIPASSFALIGQTLPIVRNVIIHHSQSGVSTYEIIRITFSAASS